MRDHELISDFVKNGDVKAFETLMDRYSRTGISFACKMVGDISVAEDIVQDAFIKFYENACGFVNEEKGFSSWFFKVVYNAAIDLLRKSGRYNELDDNLVYDDGCHAYDAVEDAETADALFKAMAMLPERQKEALLLHYYESVDRIDGAAVMNISLKAYESLLSRAKCNLKLLLKGIDL